MLDNVLLPLKTLMTCSSKQDFLKINRHITVINRIVIRHIPGEVVVEVTVVVATGVVVVDVGHHFMKLS